MKDKRYFELIYHQRVFIIGRAGPPWSGFSVHIDRVRAALIKQHNELYFFDLEIRKEAFWLFLYRMILVIKLLWWRPKTILCYAARAQNDITEFSLFVYWKWFFFYQNHMDCGQISVLCYAASS